MDSSFQDLRDPMHFDISIDDLDHVPLEHDPFHNALKPHYSLDVSSYLNAESPASTNKINLDDDGFNVNNENNCLLKRKQESSKRKARLVRNRESAHLSRQRKKQYVGELVDKVKAMHSTIHHLNAKVSYVMAENMTLRQQMYPWMPAPPYILNPRASHVPISRTSKKAESKKVASVTFLGLLFFMMLFGGLVPMVNVRYGGMNRFYERQHGNGDGDNVRGGPDGSSNVRSSQQKGYDGEPKTSHAGDEFVGGGNGSEPLMASLYVPRNDKLVKIDGNLIIHSVLPSHKAMASHETYEVKKSDETGLAVPGDLASSIPRRNSDRHPHLALGSGAKNVNSGTTAADGSLQQWFREGLAGPTLRSGMCTEVFQFEVSAASGAMIPATSSTNASSDNSRNGTNVSKGGRHRRILHDLPIALPESSTHDHNISEERTRGSGKRNDTEADSAGSSMVVSVLVDPREAADTEGDGPMGQKSLSRIFVVLLIDSMKYVTYSCMLPFNGSFPHLVTT